ncbi:MFS transporter [Streptomyces sp. NBC_00264]|uniref:MFS transporter n=1 Tax=unclassified Streptomyces TaxID=2593676 RepID=UPI000F5C04EF|nr:MULTISPECIES: MFS transporter [unclassified Streptomyces]WSG50816.1 MFS transporter [Streptomyces sp. NBC_01732]WSX01480.1 MFS transporter [Streptomyces sp. NBC_00987]MCX5160243.1 MFS transporter [Streptomyces sp. NBC_00305]MCX5218766.1 MFS transporter [Streptomyces sp. NBC_00264]RPK74009.1 Major Facilitator Superfamily protein [Streptomyces sp. ADI95-17]
MRTYRELFRTPQFGPLFATSAVQVAASTTSGLALGTLVYAATDSPLLAALSMFGSSLAQVIGATVLMSAADRLPPRAATTGMALAFGLATAVLAVPGLPLPVVFAIILAEGAVAAVGGGVRYGLLNEVLPKDGYLLGRSVLNMCSGLMQIGGFALGGLLVATLSARGTLLVAAALYLAGAVVARFGLARRPPRSAGRPSAAETWRINAVLWSSGPRRRVYLALWVPNGLIVGCESLFVPYAPEHAGLLFAFAALGMLVGDTVAGRFFARRWRGRLATPLQLLLAAPYLLFATRPAFPAALALAALASVGFAASLLFQERLMALVPDEFTGQALGLHSSGMLTMQGVAAALAGTVAQWTSPATAMTVMAAASIAVSLALTAAGRRAAGAVDSLAPHGTSEAVDIAGAADRRV